MLNNDVFASQVATVEDLPASFGRALIEHVEEPPRLIIFSPAYSNKEAERESAVVLTDHRWFVALASQDGSIAVDTATFEDTLFIELTVFLLYGRLRIDFVSSRQRHTTAIVFNTVMERLFMSVVDEVIKGTHPALCGKKDEPWTEPRLNEWPIKFYNLALHHLPQGADLCSATYWPAICGCFRQELVPAAALLDAGGALLWMSDIERSWWMSIRGRQSLGAIFTYYPLSRLGSYMIDHYDNVSVLSLEMRAGGGGTCEHIAFPTDLTPTVLRLMKQALPDIT